MTQIEAAGRLRFTDRWVRVKFKTIYFFKLTLTNQITKQISALIDSAVHALQRSMMRDSVR